ncbi:hypothetical protein HELRODRAFT_189001 [Helobdella robusta]|uniref:Protein RIC1 homolog n=1 Tax=Helobdella robusta TaxID=6412 RepID=T1FQJ7_HELRO|nr:hypothetical protein HELRODRAFT_189001 [Helobdella robusta]ESN99121.1 hypothetical protein HELRODRAFT_189001 [Helobdella robusta]
MELRRHCCFAFNKVYLERASDVGIKILGRQLIMYFPIGWPRCLKVCYNDECKLLDVVASFDKLFLAVLSEKTVGIWFCKPHVEIVGFRRTRACISKFGDNQFCKWKPDSSYLAIATSLGYIIFFKLEKTTNTQTCYEQRFSSSILPEDGESNFQTIPSLNISMSHYIQIPGGVTSMVSLREEIMISTSRGLLQRIYWSDGHIKSNATIELASLPFSADLQHSRSIQLNNSSVHVSLIDYSPQMGGFAVVLSDGRAAFLAANSLKFEPHGIVYNLDAVTGSLVVSHRLIISSKEFPDASQVCGPVMKMRWTSDGSALAMSWLKGGFAIWSVFGSLLLQSMGLNSGDQKFFKFTSLEWGCEGYHLLMIRDEGDDDITSNNVTNELHETDDMHVVPPSASSSTTTLISQDASTITSSSLATASSSATSTLMGNQVHLLLQGEDRLYLNPEDGLGESSSTAYFHQTPSAIVGNRQWHVMTLPSTYIVNNWPIRYAAMSSSGHWIAVAGRRGMVHYALSTRKWKMFGNEMQERDMMVAGGLLWWREFICAACYNMLDQRDEVRFYPRDSKLDNAFAHVVKTPSQIVLLNIFYDYLIVLFSDCIIAIYHITKKMSAHKSFLELNVTKLQEVNIINFIPHPSNVAAITLTSLRTDAGSTKKNSDDGTEAESILINVAGRVLLFQRDRSTANDGSAQKNWLAFTAPVIVASSVENMWLSWRSNHQKPHLTNVLWLGCGANGTQSLKVWLPLQQREDMGKNKGFLSKRIMLPFAADIYPLAMLFEAGIILGAISEAVCYSTNGEETGQRQLPYLQLERTSQVYLHHILRQLLRRNLGVHALEIARGCTDLVYFPHVLELLIHEVLEEEATSKEPIPGEMNACVWRTWSMSLTTASQFLDALLPRVVAFVEEFPEYLQTIAHCARKSDVAVWEYFFSVVGNPADLFQDCLKSHKLTTAASYLIILQNLEKPNQARQHAISLLDAALNESSWDLARDLVRYLSVIDLTCDTKESGSSKLRIRQNSQSIYHSGGFYSTSPSATNEAAVDPFLHGGVVRARSLSKEEQTRDQQQLPKGMVKGSVGKADNHATKRDSDSMERFNVESILDRHAKKLLKSYKLRDLAKFSANLEDYQLVSWLKKERTLSARVDDYVSALKTLHDDFKWPYPVVPLSNLTRLTSTNSLASTGSGSSQLDLVSEKSSDVNNTANSMNHSETASCEKESTDSWNEVTGSSVTMSSFSEMDRLCLDLASLKTGPPQSNIQLRFLYQLLMEAYCYEWASVCSIVLQDVTLFSRVVSSAYLPDTPEDCIKRMNEGLKAFKKWSETECLGYEDLLRSLHEDILLLESLEKKTSTSSLSSSASNQASKRLSMANQLRQNSVETHNKAESDQMTSSISGKTDNSNTSDNTKNESQNDDEEITGDDGNVKSSSSDRTCIIM